MAIMTNFENIYIEITFTSCDDPFILSWKVLTMMMMMINVH